MYSGEKGGHVAAQSAYKQNNEREFEEITIHVFDVGLENTQNDIYMLHTLPSIMPPAHMH